MGLLTYSMMMSLDGFINDPDGRFDWDQISPEVHACANQAARRIGTEVYGRRMYEMMVYWETAEGPEEVEREFAELWRSHDKIVVSKSLDRVSSERTELVSSFGVEDMQALKDRSERAISVSGPTIASVYLNAGLVDEIEIFTIPVLVGAGTPMFPCVQQLMKFERVETSPFANGVVYSRYRARA